MTKFLIDQAKTRDGQNVGYIRPTWPFVVLGDRDTMVFARDVVVSFAAYKPLLRGTPDEKYAACILVDESAPEFIGVGDMVKITRTYASVPPTLIDPSKSIMVTRPAVTLSGGGPSQIGDYVVFQPDSSQDLYDAYLKKLVTSDSGQPSADGYPTGGTWDAAFAGYTASANSYNISASSLQTALNALTSVTNRGGCTVAGSYNGVTGFTVTFAAYAAMGLDTSGLSGNGNLDVGSSVTNSGYTQVFHIKRGANDVAGDITSLTTAGTTKNAAYNAYASGTTRSFQIYSDGNFNGGTYRLQLYGTYTAAIAYNASFATVEAALNALGIGTFTVGQHPLGATDTAPNSSGTQIRGLITWVRVPLATGTYRLLINGTYTGNIAYNADATAVQTAMNAHATVSARGGVTVSGNCTDGFSANYVNPLIIGNASSLTPSGSSITVVTTDGGIGRVQQITFTAGSSAQRSLYCANHGLTATDDCYVKAGTNYYTFDAGGISLPDANTIIVLAASGSPYRSSDTITEIGKRTKQGYAPGADPVPATEVTRFSLTTIPAETYQGDDARLLQAIFGNVGTINYRIGDATRWPSDRSPIRSRTTTQISTADL